MTFEATLSREQFIRLSILRHIQRRTFYFWAIVCAILTAFALVRGPYVLLYAAWVPFLLYLLAGVFIAVQQGLQKDQPYFLATRYDFDKKGVSLSTAQGTSELGWEYFADWKKVAHCYVLSLTAGPILAIPQKAVPAAQVSKFEALLDKHLKKQA